MPTAGERELIDICVSTAQRYQNAASRPDLSRATRAMYKRLAEKWKRLADQARCC